MQIQVRQVGDVMVLQPAGKLRRDGGVTLKIAVVEAMQSGGVKVLCNLQDVTYVDSAGVSDLVQARAAVTNNGGTIKLCSVTPWVAQVFTLTQITQAFEIYDTEAEALESFG